MLNCSSLGFFVAQPQLLVGPAASPFAKQSVSLAARPRAFFLQNTVPHSGNITGRTLLASSARRVSASP